MNKDKISVKGVRKLDEAAAYLEAFARSLRSGRILVEQGGESLTLCPPEALEVDVQARSKKGKQKFSLELCWTESEHGEEMGITPAPDPAAVPLGEAGAQSSAPAVKAEAAVPATRAEARTPALKPEAEKSAAPTAPKPAAQKTAPQKSSIKKTPAKKSAAKSASKKSKPASKSAGKKAAPESS